MSPLRAYSGATQIMEETNKVPRYYVLVAACVLARKTEWLRNACLAAALIFPATAAIHAIVIAALHVDGKPLPRPGTLLYLTLSQGPSTWISMARFNFARSGS